MEKQHTKGPWNYCQESADPEWWIVTLPGGLIVANVNAHANQEANARLIAAAPDLLAACKELLFDAFEDAHPDAVKKARAAIAKAEGTTP